MQPAFKARNKEIDPMSHHLAVYSAGRTLLQGKFEEEKTKRNVGEKNGKICRQEKASFPTRRKIRLGGKGER